MFAEASSDGLTVQSSDGTSEELQAELQPVAAAADAPVHETGHENEDTEAAPAVVAKAGKPRNSPIARMEEATAKEAAAKRDAEAARRETAELRQRLDALERPKPEAAKPETKQAEWKRYRAMPDAPKLGEFDGDEALEDWNAAMALFIADKRYEERRTIETQETRDEQAKQSLNQKLVSVREKLDAAEASEPGFLAEVASLMNTPPISAFYGRDGKLIPNLRDSQGRPVTPSIENWVIEQIMHSPIPDKMLRHFAKDGEIQRLKALHPDPEDGLREFLRIEARLTPAAAPQASGPAQTVKSSVAKPPIRPERGSAQVGSDEPPGEDASDAEHEAYWGPRRAKLRHA